MAHSLPTFTSEPPQTYDVETDAVLVQKGIARTPSFFADSSFSSAAKAFDLGVRTAATYAGHTSRKDEIVQTRTETSGFRLTQEEYALLQKRAGSIHGYSKVPYDTCEDFLIILCFVDKIKDMEKIADGVQIAELADESILRNPMAILNLPRLENIAFAAQALDGLVNLFRKYITTAQNTENKSQSGDDLGSIISSISSLVSGMGGMMSGSGGPRLETADMGNFLSELITGNRIPMNVIAKNPMKQSPSYVGKAFFGEYNNPLSNVDIDELFNKVIAVFPKPSAGSGTSAFSMQNFSSFSGSMSVTGFVSKVMTGSANITSDRKLNQVMSVVNKVTSLTGAKSTDIIEITRADNAIPMMMAMSTAFSGFDKSVFSGSTFQDGWMAAQSVAQQLSTTNPSFIEAARRFL